MLKALKKTDYLLVVITTAFCLLASVVYLHQCERQYQANLVVMESANGSMSKNSSSLNSLLMNGNNNRAIDIYSEIILSSKTAELLIKDDVVMKHYFRDAWDSDHHVLRTHFSLIGGAVRAIVSFLTGTPPQQPTPSERLLGVLRKNVSLKKDARTQMVRINCVDNDPAMAAYILQRLNMAAGSYLRIMAQQDADETSKALEAHLRHVNNIDLRDAVTSMVINQEVSRLLSSSYASYMVSVIVPATADTTPISPKPAMIFLFALIFGFAVPAVVLIRWRNGMTLYGLEKVLAALAQRHARRFGEEV
jgi:uncharacterized protein involved in exopolysaccharide biosynthesis